MKCIKLCLLMALMSLGIDMHAQTDEARHFNIWLSLKAKVDINDRFYVNSQISLRRYDFLKSWQKIILRTRGLYKLNESMVCLLYTSPSPRDRG